MTDYEIEPTPRDQEEEDRLDRCIDLSFEIYQDGKYFDNEKID